MAADRREVEGILSGEAYALMREDPAYRSELSRGWLVREPQPGALHGEATGRIYERLRTFVQARGLGRVTNQTGFELRPIPRTVRGPDVAFVRSERVPAEAPTLFWPFTPDLAVEVAIHRVGGPSVRRVAGSPAE